MERVDQSIGRCRHFLDSLIESGFVCTRWSRGATQLSDELQRRRTNLVVGSGWLEIGQRFDVPAHTRFLDSVEAHDHLKIRWWLQI
jgi:hypothetical protein